MMLLYRIAKCKYSADLSGYGSRLHAGRWHSEGTSVLYTSTSISLAMLEVLAHFPAHIPAVNMCLLTLEVSDKYLVPLVEKLSENWNHFPAPAYLQKIGNEFVSENKGLLLQVPSAIVPSEVNVLINPNHKLFSHIKVIRNVPFLFDARLQK
jgi:RES domain-containing protein